MDGGWRVQGRMEDDSPPPFPSLPVPPPSPSRFPPLPSTFVEGGGGWAPIQSRLEALRAVVLESGGPKTHTDTDNRYWGG